MSTGSALLPPIPTSDSSLLGIEPILPPWNATALVETLLYGIHFVLFCICLFILTREGRPTHWIILGSALIMFALSTADVSLTIRLMTHDITTTTLDNMLKRLSPKYPIFITNKYISCQLYQSHSSISFIAELTLLYRCYMVWGRSNYLLVATSLLVIGDTVWVFLSLSHSFVDPPSKFICAGRIFWASQLARPTLGHRNLGYYHFVIAILLESSAMYSACLLIYLLFPSHSPYRLVSGVIGNRMVAIVPTLLIVQIGLDRIIRDSDPSDWERHAASNILDTIVIANHEIQDTSHSDVHEDPRYP